MHAPPQTFGPQAREMQLTMSGQTKGTSLISFVSEIDDFSKLDADSVQALPSQQTRTHPHDPPVTPCPHALLEAAVRAQPCPRQSGPWHPSRLTSRNAPPTPHTPSLSLSLSLSISLSLPLFLPLSLPSLASCGATGASGVVLQRSQWFRDGRVFEAQ